MPLCASCGKENPDGARFCLECGAALAAAAPPEAPRPPAACPSCGTENPAGARFCLSCGTALAAAPVVAQEERKVITALFTDIVGSTAAAEHLDPEDVRARLAPYYARVRKELERYGGSVEKFIGDAVVALFGAPVAHEDDPERAVRAALAVREAIAELNEADAWLDLHIRTAVNTGEALVVLGAAAGEGEGMAAGDVMNTAARLQSAAPVDGVVVGEQTYRATAHVVEYREAEPVQAKGKSEPLPVWEVVAVKDAPGRRPSSWVPLVGREADLDRIWQAWLEVQAQRRPILVTVLGPPGIGKSRLLAEVAERAADAGVHWGRCVPYGEGITYWPVTEILRDAAGIRGTDDNAVASAKLGALLDDLPTDDADELRTMAAAIANLVGTPTTPRGTYLAEEIAQNELHWGIRRVFQLLAAQRPLVLGFEDLHWAEPTLLDLIRYLLDGDAEAPMLLLASARPELADSRPAILAADGDRRVVELAALDERQSEALLAELVPGAIPEGRLAALLRNAGGNPLFLEETVQMLADVGRLDEGGADEPLPVPANLQALIGSRLDALQPAEKGLAQRASVVGPVFWPGAVAHMDGLDGDLAAGLAALERRDFVHEQDGSTVAGEREYAFKHILIRDVAYAQVPKGQRARLHVRFAEWAERLPGGREELVEILAHHLEQACRLAREVARSPVEPPVLPAAEALSRAGQKAERREGTREADRYYARALELLEGEHAETALELRLRRCGTLVALGELKRAYDELLEVSEEALRLRRPDIRCEALLGLANIDKKQGRGGEAHTRVGEAGSIAREIGDRCLEIRALYESANLRGWFAGEFEEAVDDLRHGVAIAEELDERPLRIEGHMRAGSLLFNIGRLAEAEAQAMRALALASEIGSFRDEARATTMLSFLTYYRGRVDEAEHLALQALDWLERTCDSHQQLQNLRGLAKYALSRDDPKLAEERLRAAVPLALEAGGWLVIEVYRYLTEALVRQRRLDDARELVAFARKSVPEEDLYACAALKVAEAMVAEASGEAEAAVGSFREALGLLEQANQRMDLGEAHLEFGRTLVRLGELETARAELGLAREIFAPMQAQAPLAEIERELARIGDGAGVSAGPAKVS